MKREWICLLSTAFFSEFFTTVCSIQDSHVRCGLHGIHVSSMKKAPFCPFVFQEALVQFLIENYPRIFAQDSTHLLEGSSPTGDNSEEAAGKTQGGIGTGGNRQWGCQGPWETRTRYCSGAQSASQGQCLPSAPSCEGWAQVREGSHCPENKDEARSLTWIFLCVGSKHPNDIQESHVPHTVLLPQEPEDTTTSSTQGPRELPGEFIEKASRPARQQPQKDERFPSCKGPLLTRFLETISCHGNDSPRGTVGWRKAGQRGTEVHSSQPQSKFLGLKSRPSS